MLGIMTAAPFAAVAIAEAPAPIWATTVAKNGYQTSSVIGAGFEAIRQLAKCQDQPNCYKPAAVVVSGALGAAGSYFASALYGAGSMLGLGNWSIVVTRGGEQILPRASRFVVGATNTIITQPLWQYLYVPTASYALSLANGNSYSMEQGLNSKLNYGTAIRVTVENGIIETKGWGYGSDPRSAALKAILGTSYGIGAAIYRSQVEEKARENR
jgi:hypothetical protein